MNSLIESVLKTEAPYGTAVMWHLGQMGLLIRLGSTLLCVDYYASTDPDRLFPPPIPAKELAGVDVFLGTHNHLDHMDHASWRIWADQCPEARFVFPAPHLEAVLADGISPARCVGMKAGDLFHAREVSVRCLPAAHEFLSPDPVTGCHPCLQYIIEGNGVRIYHAGDTLRYEGMLPALQAMGPIDAALLPINGRDGQRYRRGCIGNMTFQEAADLAGELRPRLVLPGHWDLFADNPGDPAAFADYLDAKYPGLVACVIPVRGQPIFVRAARG